MNVLRLSFWLVLFSSILLPESFAQESAFRALPVAVYRDKMKAGWIGQIAGVTWSAPTEFRWRDRIIPDAQVPVWQPNMINNAFGQDDLYVEMTFLRSLEQYGLNVSARQAGIDFANSEYPVWCANDAGRKNLRAGIAPPDSGHPQFNKCPNDIDYQIEADYSGLVAPGMPNTAIALGEKFGRLMNYSDGIYGGIFVGGMYAEAFFEDEPLKIIDAGLQCIPRESQYAEMVRDVVAWYKANPDDWQSTWRRCQTKYRENPEYQRCSNGGIDVKINGAYILMGLLYGNKDLDQTIKISMRCGQDSDCNPSNAAGILFTTQGYSRLPAKFTQRLNETKKFDFTAYNVPQLLGACEKLTRQIVVQEGGRITRDASSAEVFMIPVKKPVPPRLELSWAPQPIARSVYTKTEEAKIRFPGFRTMEDAVAALLPGWSIRNCGSDMEPGKRANYRGKKNVLMTHPLSQAVPCTLERRMDIPANRKTVLKAVVSNYPQFDWELVFRVNGIARQVVLIDEKRTKGGWAEVVFDLTPFAGEKNVHIELENKTNGWMNEAGYWAELSVSTPPGSANLTRQNTRLTSEQLLTIESLKKDLIRWQPCFLHDVPNDERQKHLDDSLSHLDPVLVGKHIVFGKRWLNYIGNDRSQFPFTRQEFTHWVNQLDKLYECFEDFVGHRTQGNGVVFIDSRTWKEMPQGQAAHAHGISTCSGGFGHPDFLKELTRVRTHKDYVDAGGIQHEIAHLFDSGKWAAGGEGSVWVLYMYALEKGGFRHATLTQYPAQDRHNHIKNALKSIASNNVSAFEPEDGPYKLYLLGLVEKVGWETYKKTIQSYHNGTYTPSQRYTPDLSKGQTNRHIKAREFFDRIAYFHDEARKLALRDSNVLQNIPVAGRTLTGAQVLRGLPDKGKLLDEHFTVKTTRLENVKQVSASVVSSREEILSL